MRDITITADQQKTEFKFLAFSFLIAFCLNIGSIIAFKSEWKELYTQLFPMLALTAVIYLILGVFRSTYRIIRKK